MTDRRASPRATPDRRAAPRRAPLRRDTLHVEPLDLRAAVAQRAAWAALAARSLEANPFFEPAFLLPALHGLPASRQPALLAVRKRCAGAMRLIGLLPLAPARAAFPLGPLQAFAPAGAASGVPLVDHDHAGDALAGMLAHAGARRGVGGLLLRRVERDGPVAALLARLAAGLRPPLKAFNAAPQAMLRAGADAWSPAARAQSDALAAQGPVAFAAHEGEAALDALERALALDAGLPAQKAAARATAFALAREGRCVVGELRLADAPVGAAVAAVSGDLAAIWLSAGARSCEAFAPEAQARIRLAEALMRRPGLARIVCAPQLAPLWPVGAETVDLLAPGLPAPRDGVAGWFGRLRG